MKLLVLFVIFVSITFASEDQSYNLEFYGDSISKSLIRNNYIESRNDLEKIEEVLIFNNLDWDRARKLPVGMTYYVSRKVDNQELTPRKKVVKEIDSLEHDFTMEVGVLYQNQSINNIDIYSDLSQYVEASYSVKNYKVSLNMQRLIYSVNSEQNIIKDHELITYDLQLLKLFKINKLKFRGGLYTKNLQLFRLSDLNAIVFDSANSSGIDFEFNFDLLNIHDLNFYANINVQKSISASELRDYHLIAPKLGMKLKKLDIELMYSFSRMKLESFNINDQSASLGVKTSF